MEYQIFDRVKLKDGRSGTIMDMMGPDFVVDIGQSDEEYDTILVKP